MSNLPDADRLRSLVGRIENLDAQQREIGSDKKDVYSEAKSSGYSPKVIRRVVQARRKGAAERREEDEVFGLYMAAVEGGGGTSS